MNKLKLGSILIRRVQTTASDNVKKSSSNRKYKLLFASTTLSLAGFYFYYQSYLNDQEKRRVRVNIKSLFRAIRFV
jgi:hypothetical protein